jgi:hypothetical protein
MGFVIPFAMFGVAVGVIFIFGLRDKRNRKASSAKAVRPPKAA